MTQKKRMLFVDDRSKRIHAALAQFSADYEVLIATNVKEALRALAREEFEVVSLDHDLTGCDFEDPDTPTCGMEIVRYLEKTGWPPTKTVPTFIIHSSNVFAAYLMVRRLRGAGYKAFAQRFVYDQPVERFRYDGQGVPV